MTKCDSLKRDNEYLQSRLDDMRAVEERRLDEARRERDERRKEQRRAYQESLCEASSWPEAFRKGIPRIETEAYDEVHWNATRSDDEPIFDHFQNWLKEVKRLEEIYQEEELAVREQFEKLRSEMLNRVADRLQAEFGETGTVEAVRANDYEQLVNW
jgi:hypothetical protein